MKYLLSTFTSLIAATGLTFFASVAMVLTSTAAHAEGDRSRLKRIDNKIEDVEKAVAAIKKTVGEIDGKVKNLPTTVTTSLGISLNTDITDKAKETIEEMKVVLSDLKNRTASFGDGSFGTECYYFKEDLKGLFGNFNILNSQLMALGLPDAPEIETPDWEALDIVPCGLLIGGWLAVENTPLEEVVDRFDDAIDAVLDILPLFSTDQLVESRVSSTFDSSFTASLNPPEPTILIHSDYCKRVVERGAIILERAIALKAQAVAFRILAAIIDDESLTGVADMRKVRPRVRGKSVGLHGYADIKLDRKSSAHQFAGGLNMLAEVLDALSDFTFQINSDCGTSNNQYLIYQRQQEILDKLEKGQ